jgi:hypothetical protein
MEGKTPMARALPPNVQEYREKVERAQQPMLKLATDHAIAQIGKQIGEIFAAGDYERFATVCIEFQIFSDFLAQGLSLVDVALGFAGNVDELQICRAIYEGRKAQLKKAGERATARRERYRQKHPEE